MATYTFTVSVGYSLTTHHVVFTSTQLQVFLTSTSEKVYDQSFENGKDFRCSGNDFQIGTITADGMFTKTVDLSLRTSKLWIEEESGANKFIGADNFGTPGIFNIYDLNQCPVRLSKTGSTAYIKCPCESEKGPCANACYQYGES